MQAEDYFTRKNFPVLAETAQAVWLCSAAIEIVSAARDPDCVNDVRKTIHHFGRSQQSIPLCPARNSRGAGVRFAFVHADLCRDYCGGRSPETTIWHSAEGVATRTH